MNLKPRQLNYISIQRETKLSCGKQTETKYYRFELEKCNIN